MRFNADANYEDLQAFSFVIMAKVGTLETRHTVNVTLNDVNDVAPEIALAELVITSGENDPFILTERNLKFTDGDRTEEVASNIIYTIETMPTGVTITKNGVTLSAKNTVSDPVKNTFTHADVQQGMVKMTITDESNMDLLKLTVSDSTNPNIERTDFNIHMREIADVVALDPNSTSLDQINTVNLSDEKYDQRHFIIDTGGERDVITVSNGSNVIIGGLGGDEIILDGDTSDDHSAGKDIIVYNFEAGTNFTATDGGDIITQFKRGEDVFRLQTVTTDTTIQNLDNLLTNASVNDQLFVTINPRLEIFPLPPKYFVTGVTFNFKTAGRTYGDSQANGGNVSITFADELTWDAFEILTGILNPDGSYNTSKFDEATGRLKDASALKALMGDGSLDYELLATGISLAPGANISINENTDTANWNKTGNIIITDPDNGHFGTLELVGTHADLFEIRNGSLGKELWLKSSTPLDHEDSNPNVMNVRIQLVEKNTIGVDHVVTVIDVNEKPVITSGTTGNNLPEGTEVPITDIIYQAVWSEDLIPVDWTLDNDVNDLFRIDNSGAVRFNTNSTAADRTPDYESNRTYTFTIKAESGDHIVELPITVNVTNLDFDTDDISIGTAPHLNIVQQDAAVGTVIGSASVPGYSDSEVTYDLAEDDKTYYQIESDGEIKIKAVLPSGDTRSDTITVIVKIEEDKLVETADKTFTINAITDQPSFHAKIPEGRSAPIPLSPNTDSDGDALSFQDVSGSVNTTFGSYTLSNGNIVWTPNANWIGTEEFEVTVEDGRGGTTPMDIQIDVFRFTIWGTSEINTVVGNSDNNILDGKASADTKTGGVGKDWFTLYQGVRNAGLEQLDVVTDFTRGEDKIKIDVFGGASRTLDQLKASASIKIMAENRNIGSAALDTVIYYTDGPDSPGNDVALMVLQDVASLDRSDFVIPYVNQSEIAFSSLANDRGRGATLDGVNAGDLTGWAVSSAGDVNNDNVDDIMLSATETGNNGALSGSAYVIFGKAGGLDLSLDLSTLDGSNGFRLDGEAADDGMGYSISSAGDINNDGKDDIMVSAIWTGQYPDYRGSVYIIYGKDHRTENFSRVIDLADLEGEDGFRIDGDDEELGVSISSLGDINGDNVDDIIIASGYSDTVVAHIVYGKQNGFAQTIDDYDIADFGSAEGFKIYGLPTELIAERVSVSSADIDGNGINDIIIGLPFYSTNGTESGAFYIIYGKAGGYANGVNLSSLSTTASSTGIRIDGVAGEQLGAIVSSAGFVNNDIYEDFIISTSGSNFVDDIGYSYVVFGKAGGLPSGLNLSSLDGSNGFRIDTNTSSPNGGFSVSSAGDFNGDGRDDLIVAEYYQVLDKHYASYYIIFGKASGFDPIINLSTMDSAQGFFLSRVDAYISIENYRSEIVSEAGDINNDGYDDVVLGAYFANENQKADSGSVYVIYGHPTAAITGNAHIGNILTASGGLGTLKEYLWKRYNDDDTVEEIGTGQIYTVTEDDLGKTIRVEITFTDSTGELQASLSDETAPVGRSVRGISAGEETLNGTSGSDLIDGTGGINKMSGIAGNDVFVLYQGEGTGHRDEVRDFTAEDKIQVATTSGDESNLTALKAAANIRWTQNSDYNYGIETRDNYNSSRHPDTIIYDTKGTTTGQNPELDDVVILVLQDFTTALTMEHFDVVTLEVE